MGFSRIRGEEGTLLPGTPVDEDVPAATCGEFFTSRDGKQWLDDRF
ncbi:hypothetical protein [Streptomyces sp. NPDC047070]